MAVAGGKLCGGGASNISALLQTQTLMRSSQLPDARFILGSSPSFMGSCSMVSFEDGCGGKRPERSFARKFDQEDDDDDVGIDNYFHQPEKKRRLTHEQVQVLERSFEANNNLESERRIKLANDLGLQPRQVAIWFQNRRVRWKTKKLEKDFDSLQSSFNHLKGDFKNLLKEVEELKAEVLHLKDRLLFKEKEQGANYRLETHPQEQIVDCSSEDEVPLFFTHAQKQEDLSSANSDVFELDSPLYIDGGRSHFAKPGDSCYLFESDRSDSSQGEEDNLSKNLLPSSYIFPKIEDVDYPESPANSCNLGFQVEDHASWFWSY